MGSMTTQEGGVNVKDSRSSPRIALQCSLLLANGRQTGEGQVLNLSRNGCLVEAPIGIKPGDHLQLRLFLPDRDQSLCVSLAVVHWAEASRFGIEFLKVDEKYRPGLNQFMLAMGEDPWRLGV
jgi:hypothetical protein